MDFDDLWEIYEEKSKPKRAAETPGKKQAGQAVKEAAPAYKEPPPPGRKKEAADAGEQGMGPMPGVFGADAGNTGNAEEDAGEQSMGPMPGVFGADAGNTGNAEEGSGEQSMGPMPGVFGADAGNAGNAAEGPRGAGACGPGLSGRGRFDWGRMRYWPWVDIICIAITVVMVIGVLANFEKVTTALFRALLPLLSNLVVLLLVVGVIAFAIWRIARGPRRRR